jgi:hypothetical protein
VGGGRWWCPQGGGGRTALRRAAASAENCEICSVYFEIIPSIYLRYALLHYYDRLLWVVLLLFYILYILSRGKERIIIVYHLMQQQ